MKYGQEIDNSREISLPCTIDVKVVFSNLNHLHAVVNTLKVEASEKEIKRGSINIESHENTLVIQVVADDLVAARSLSNSILRLLKTSVDVVEIIEE